MTTATLTKPIKCNFRLLYERLNLGIYIPIQDISIEEGVSDLIYRAWQQECFDDCKASGKQHWIVNAPTGSGKSNILLGLSIDALKNDKDHLVILACPQKEIGKGFFKRIWKIDGIDTTIRDNNQLCGDKLFTDTGKVERLKDFIEGKRHSHETDRMIVCTHATLSFVLERVDKSKMKNITLIVDEGHHIRTDDVNGLGKVANYFLDNDSNKLNLIVSSATPFRGDRAQIIPASEADRFHTFFLNYDRHLIENCNGLAFSYEFFFNHKGRGNAHTINTIFQRTGVRKTIIFIPRSGTMYSHDRNKRGDVDEVIRGIGNTNRATFTWDLKTMNNGVHIVKLVNRNGKMIRVLDLVMEEDRTKRLDYLRDNPDDIDIVIGINVPKEGFDWTVATREIIIGKIGSLTEMIQMIGRCFRQHKSKDNGKTKVEIIQIFPKVDIQKLDNDKVRTNFNDFMKTIYVVFAGRLVLNPVVIKLPMEIKRKNGLKPIDTVSDYLLDKLDGGQYKKLFDDVSNDLYKWSVNNENHTEEQYLTKLKDIVTTRLAEVGIDEYQEEITQYFHKTWESTAEVMSDDKPITEDDMIPNINGIDINDINITLVKPYKNPMYKTLSGCIHELGNGMTMQEFDKLLVPVDTLRRCYEVKKWVEEKGTYPSTHSKDAYEKSLAGFKNNMRGSKLGRNVCVLTQEHITVLESIPGWIWDVSDRTINRCYELAEWCNIHGKYPRKISENKDEESLHRFGTQMKRAKRGLGHYSITQEHISILETIPDWKWEKGDVITDKCYELVEWFELHGKAPSVKTRLGKDFEHERTLYYFMVDMRKAKKGQGRYKITDDQIAILETISNWRWDTSNATVDRCIELRDWCITNSKFPSRYGDEYEKSLCALMNRIKSIKKGTSVKSTGSRITDEQIKVLESIPNWKWEGSDHTTNKCIELRDWCITNSKFPSRYGDEYETTMTNLMNRMKSAKRGKHGWKITDEQIEILESIPNWKWQG